MNMLMSVPLGDWAALAIGIIGLVASYLAGRDRLPKWARKWLSRIGRDRIEDAIEYAAKLQGLTSQQRRQEAAGYIVRLCEKQLGLVIPESIANLLVEYVYQHWKRR